MKDLKEYWSLKDYPPRPEQLRIINEINEAMDMGMENIIIEAGTGIGKSAIAITIANMVGSAYILTVTKQLQSQYTNDFKSMLFEMKGRNNYDCLKGGTCDNCSLDIHEKRCPECEYLTNLNVAQDCKTLLTNYHHIYFAGNYAGIYHTRDLLVLDEAHNFEKTIMNLISSTLNRDYIKSNQGIDIFETITNGGTLRSIENPEYWINILEKLIDILKSETPTIFIEKLARDRKISRYNELINHLKKDDWIIELPTKKDILEDKKHLNVEFKPLTIEDYSDSILHFGKTRLFLTGTLGDKDKFCEWIGIDPVKTTHFYVKSPFPLKNRPIICDYVGSMSNNAWKNKRSINKIKEIISTNHPKDKGVIHTSSNEQSWYIKNSLNMNNILVAQGEKRQDIINRFENIETPCILIGAGLKDGVDFKYEKCRFQIIFKMPYPKYSGQIACRSSYDPSWYQYQTIMPLMQAYGRGVRAMDDYCDTYILDSDFERLIHNNYNFFNEYFIEAIQPEGVI